MGEERSHTETGGGRQEWHQEAPMVEDALRRGTLLRANVAGGAEWRGYVCDRDGLGLLLEIHDVPGGEAAGYKFFPWSSVEHLTIEEARRDGSFLTGPTGETRGRARRSLEAGRPPPMVRGSAG